MYKSIYSPNFESCSPIISLYPLPSIMTYEYSGPWLYFIMMCMFSIGTIKGTSKLDTWGTTLRHRTLSHHPQFQHSVWGTGPSPTYSWSSSPLTYRRWFKSLDPCNACERSGWNSKSLNSIRPSPYADEVAIWGVNQKTEDPLSTLLSPLSSSFLQFWLSKIIF